MRCIPFYCLLLLRSKIYNLLFSIFLYFMRTILLGVSWMGIAFHRDLIQNLQNMVAWISQFLQWNVSHQRTLPTYDTFLCKNCNFWIFIFPKVGSTSLQNFIFLLYSVWPIYWWIILNITKYEHVHRKHVLFKHVSVLVWTQH